MVTSKNFNTCRQVESVAQLPAVISKESSTEKSFKFLTKEISPFGRNDKKVVVQHSRDAGPLRTLRLCVNVFKCALKATVEQFPKNHF